MRERADNELSTSSSSTTGGWIGLIRIILTTSGPVALLAILLSAFLGYAVWGRLDRIENNQGKILGEMGGAKVSMSAFVAQHMQIENERSLLLQSQVKLLRQLCVNAAKTETQARGCLAE
jgi:hypothetical protein